jgi:uncharacterized protein (TIGR03083 family)
MPTQLGIDDHIQAIMSRGRALRDAAAAAGLDAPVPTCPTWTVTKLVAHQAMVHRWAAANLRGDKDHDTKVSHAQALAAPDLLAWFSEGLDALVETVKATPDDAKAMVFLNDAPAPRRFWARRQAHETTIHSVDAIAARLGRWPTAADTDIEPVLADDGLDELLIGFITRGAGKIHATPPYTLVVRTEDTGRAWTLTISDGPTLTGPGEVDQPDAVFSGTAAQLYLSLWNRANEIRAEGRPDVIDEWRSSIKVRWS